MKPSVAKLTLAERAAQLPPPQPGKSITIPLELAPAWLKLHHREIIGFDAQRFLYLGHRAPNKGHEENHK